MPDVKPAAGAIILAAGPSSRLGQPKQLLRIEGESLVRRAARFAMEAGCAPVIVVTGAGSDAVKAELAGTGALSAFNPDWSAGMGASLRAGISALLAADSHASAAILLVCDQPHLSANVIAQLLQAKQSTGLPMAACAYANTVGPPCCFDRSLFPALAKIADTEGAKSLLLADLKSVARLDWQPGHIDLDEPGDLPGNVDR